ncbi:sigma 54-interacting transcriptional regulator [Megalodesulfovibrio paquesii]
MRTPPHAPVSPSLARTFAALPDWFARREVIPLDETLALVVSHAAMHGVVAACRQAAESGRPVLLTGETGVGKSLLARFIHAHRDPYASFVSRVTEGLGTSTLLARIFGEGAPEDVRCLLAEAAGGTLVLEEIGALPLAVQQRLVAGWHSVPATPPESDGPAQWILSTHHCLAERLRSGAFLPAFAAACLHVHVPPLRERRQDIPAILAALARLHDLPHLTLDRLEALADHLAGYDFPGNVRELESIMTMEAYGLHWELPREPAAATERSLPRT